MCASDCAYLEQMSFLWSCRRWALHTWLFFITYTRDRHPSPLPFPQVYGGNLARKGTDSITPLPKAAPRPLAPAPLLPGALAPGSLADLDGNATMPIMPLAPGARPLAPGSDDPFAALNAPAAAELPPGMMPYGNTSLGAGFPGVNGTEIEEAPMAPKAKAGAASAAAGAATLLAAAGAALLLL